MRRHRDLPGQPGPGVQRRPQQPGALQHLLSLRRTLLRHDSGLHQDQGQGRVKYLDNSVYMTTIQL